MNNPATDAEVFFHEVQRSRQWWLWLIVLVVTAASWYSFINQVVLGRVIGSQPASNAVIVILWILAGVALPSFFLIVKLEVTVFTDRVDIRFYPMLKRSYAAAQILDSFPRVYRPMIEYGGWGVRWSPLNGWAYNTGGKAGVQLILADGRKLLIGSQRADELGEAIGEMRARNAGLGGKGPGKGKAKKKRGRPRRSR